jgi:hypothetical protein
LSRRCVVRPGVVRVLLSLQLSSAVAADVKSGGECIFLSILPGLHCTYHTRTLLQQFISVLTSFHGSSLLCGTWLQCKLHPRKDAILRRILLLVSQQREANASVTSSLAPSTCMQLSERKRQVLASEKSEFCLNHV